MIQKIKEQIRITRQIRTIKKSVRFSASWYLKTYPDIAENGIDPAKHYLIFGWKEGRDPSENFITKEYLEINEDVNFCPLYHYEKYGKYERRHCRFNIEDEPELTFLETILVGIYTTWKNMQKIYKGIQKRFHYSRINICKNKVLFVTYQYQYICNPKYVCEELLKRDSKCEIVWLYDEKRYAMKDIPKGIKCVQFDTEEAREEVCSAHIIIENGILLFDWMLKKKSGQIDICTWHGTIPIKKIGKDIIKTKEEMRVAKMYGKVHDIVLTSSTFDNKVFRMAFWPNSELWKIGQPRTDILFQIQSDPMRAVEIKEKVCRRLKIPVDYNLVLYAPTFRDTDRNAVNSENKTKKENIYCKLNSNLLINALEGRFGGKWIILIRYHYVSGQNDNPYDMLSKDVISATEYDDMQELIIAADIGITDYSSWATEFLLTGKPGFLFAPDEDFYAVERGFYYPLSSTPFPLAHTTEELCNNIIFFDNEDYQKKKKEFLIDKGIIDNGTASKKVVDRILEIIGNDAV